MVASADVSNLAAKRPGRELTHREPEVGEHAGVRIFPPIASAKKLLVLHS